MFPVGSPGINGGIRAHANAHTLGHGFLHGLIDGFDGRAHLGLNRRRVHAFAEFLAASFESHQGRVRERTPPVAHVLITSAPYFTFSRTARRACSGPLITPSSGPLS